MKSFLITVLSLVLVVPVFAQQETQETQQREVTLKDAINLALKNNLDIAIEEFNPDITATQVTFEEIQVRAFPGRTIELPEPKVAVVQLAIGTKCYHQSDFVEFSLGTATLPGNILRHRFQQLTHRYQSPICYCES